MLLAPLSAGLMACSATSSSLLPVAVAGLAVLKRSSTFLSLTAPRPRADGAAPPPSFNQRPQDGAPDAEPAGPSAFELTFAPFARQLSRSAGGFDGARHWPLGAAAADSHHHVHATTLLGHSLTCAASTPASFFLARHHHHHSAAPARAAAHTSALAAEAPPVAAAAVVAPAGMLGSFIGKVQPRMKGFSRKLALRQFNRKIVARVARRFTIGIPVLGFYFVSLLIRRDVARVRAELAAGRYSVAALFATAVAAAALDLAAQATIISGLAHANLGVGLAGAAALLAAADSASLGTAALSFSAGLCGELLTLSRGAGDAEAAKDA